MSKLNNLILLVTTLLFSCNDEAKPTTAAESPTAKTYYISAHKTSEVSAETLRSFTQAYRQAELTALLKYDVRSFVLTYSTTYKGKSIEASGLVLLPVGLKDSASIISIQHGTTFAKDEAPSQGGALGMELFASAGYVAVVPDFIGYGSSADVFHPYYDKEHSAMAVIHMIKAAREFLVKENIAFSDDLFLGGYSEGGYVTLAAAEEIESNPEHKLKLSGVAAGAGGYDLISMLKGVTTNSYYSYPAYLAFVLMSYNTTYDWNRPLTEFFRKPYADSLLKYMNGDFGGSTINSKLTGRVDSLFTSSFFDALTASDGELPLKRALDKNSVKGWKTQTPVKLYHGSRDEIIPYQNSENTLESFEAAGSKNVSLKIIKGGTHGSAFLPMMEDFIPWFLQITKGKAKTKQPG